MYEESLKIATHSNQGSCSFVLIEQKAASLSIKAEIERQEGVEEIHSLDNI
jgi:hypothetical protein